MRGSRKGWLAAMSEVRVQGRMHVLARVVVSQPVTVGVTIDPPQTCLDTPLSPPHPAPRSLPHQQPLLAAPRCELQLAAGPPLWRQRFASSL